MTPILLIHHAARSGGHRYPPNSLAAVEHCLAANARLIEVDILPLQSDDFLLAHDDHLEHFCTGRGSVGLLRREQVQDLRLIGQDGVTSHPPALLSQILRLIERHQAPVELQLDLKLQGTTRWEMLARLVAMLRPLHPRVRVTSSADWALRHLRTLDPDLPLGFDPLLYLDRPLTDDRRSQAPPHRLGAYGYQDDHPLADLRWGPTPDYLRRRAQALWEQAPSACIWYIRAALLDSMLDEGFDWIHFLQTRGAEVAAWTLDPDRPGHVEIARRMVSAGVDRITTNDAERLAEALGDGIIF